MAEMTDYLETVLLNHVLRNTPYTPPATIYAALFTVAPGEAGGGTEVTGGTYARQAITFAAPVNSVAANSGTVNFTGMPGTTVVAVALMTAATAGSMLFYKSIANVSVNAGDTFTIDDADLTVELQ